MIDNSRAWTALLRYREAACEYFKEREALVECALIALLSNAHLFILGPPGTAKSMLAESLAGSMSGASYFYVLMHKFLTWRDLACSEVLVHEDAHGESKSIRFRNVEGPLLRSHFAFLDELFKASTALNNSILNLLQERIYTINPGEVRRAPLMMAIAASNEMPGAGEEQLRAFADRFLLWYEVEYISISHEGNSAFIDMLEDPGTPPSCDLSLQDVMYLRTGAGAVPIGRDMLGVVNSIRASLRLEHRIDPSDRRYKAAMAAVKANAFLAGHASVELGDMAVLEHILGAGREREVRDTVRRVVREYCGNAVLTDIENAYREMNELYRDALSLIERAEREIPVGDAERKRRDDYRNEALSKERRVGELVDVVATRIGGLVSRHAIAIGRFYLNQGTVLKKALIARRGVEDPFVGVSRAGL
jgi:MoxR-like ATPase